MLRAESDRRAARGLRILVADDDRDAVLTLSILLQEDGHTVFPAYHGDGVVAFVLQHQPDVVLLDIGMPGLTGFEVARQLRDKLGHACPLLVAITAWNQDKAKELGKLVGFNHYLTKPYSPKDLLSILAGLAVTGRMR